MKDAASCLSMGLQLAGRIDTVRGWVGLWAVGCGQGAGGTAGSVHRAQGLGWSVIARVWNQPRTVPPKLLLN